MKYRKLGNTGLEVSEIGFGAWGIGGTKNGAIAYGPTNDRTSKTALRRAYDLGVTFYDTADLYGYGHSEALIGMTLSDVRERIIIASKVGFTSFDGLQDFSSQHIRNSIENSLRRLQSDYIDLYQLHSPPVKALEKDDTLLTLQSLVTEGKVRAMGVSVRSPEEAQFFISKFDFQAIQVNFNFVDQRALDCGLFKLCKSKGIGLIIRTPLCCGFLTARYSEQDKYDSHDHRNSWSTEQIERWAGAYKLFSKGLMDHENQTHAQIALRFCLSYPSISSIIPGMLTEEHVNENVFSSELGVFTIKELQKFRQIYEENTFFINNSE